MPREGRMLAHPDVYFTRGYGAAVTDEHADERWISVQRFGGAWQMPLVVRPLGGGLSDAISPYGYAGVAVDPGLEPTEAAAVWSDVLVELRDLGVVSVFLRHSPWVPQGTLPKGAVSVVTGHPTRLVDVADPEHTWAQLRGRCRTSVRKAEKLGGTADVRPATAADLADEAPFRRLYEGTMRRRGASAGYLFPTRYYTRLLDALGPDLLVAEVRDMAGAVIASCLLMLHGDLMHYHLSGSDPEGAASGATNLLLWSACRTAPEHGVTSFHLGGGMTAHDALHRFKESFGGRELLYRASGLVVDPVQYDRLSAGRAVATPFFPRYRATA
ncbi:GNAT family N-acetyltransferase [Modestobacter sp. KNN46-3]|jgi:hypothetical protein|uniref:GNAT family N-acetyltransferase n=1 Tax=Modestobacter sp. KNN46-3 TaxID=2711218 RepID=UPI0013E0D531|nr:GNAT family N-acetyltransferase [Modestobacter sp. KNN46-3]